MEAAWQRLRQQGRRLMQLVGRWRRSKQLVGRWRRLKQLARVQTLIGDWKDEWLMLEGTTAQELRNIPAQLRRLQTIGWGWKLIAAGSCCWLRPPLPLHHPLQHHPLHRHLHLQARGGGSSACIACNG